ncbi:MAG: NAD-dependent epimerase/dehydratase family protein [Candidatus Thermoplasmatota archaeon]|nr:NAD-dependent epimerase/dehydratase family protein [Candidatus Thermoplasmatota archaeon]
MSSRSGKGRKALVTGGGGFLGGAIIRKLLEEGYEVSSYSRGEYPDIVRAGARSVRGDITDRKRTLEAFRGFDVVFHVAAKVGYWGEREDFWKINVDGTRNVIEACRRNSIENLVFTSSPSVIFDGKDMEGVDESVPYPKKYDSFYSETKAEAERQVLAGSTEKLRTVSLRPHLVWGPEDRHLVPAILERARRGKMVRVGGGKNTADMVYVDNAADAHVLADRALVDNPDSRGKPFFITNDDPRNVWGFIDELLTLAGLEPVKRSVPTPLAFMGAALMEQYYGLFRKGREPPLSRFLVRELSTSHWYDISAAKKELGYEPKVSMEEGLKRLKKWIDSGMR